MAELASWLDRDADLGWVVPNKIDNERLFYWIDQKSRKQAAGKIGKPNE